MVGMSQHGDPPARPLYDRIEEARARRGLSKVQVARAAGINRQTLANLKTQSRPPQPATVIQIADALDINRDEALRLAGYAAGEAEKGGVVDKLAAQVEALQAQVAALTAELTELRGSEGQRDAS